MLTRVWLINSVEEFVFLVEVYTHYYIEMREEE